MIKYDSRRLLSIAAIITLAGCGGSKTIHTAAKTSLKTPVKPVIVTDQVEFDTDDPAIWINPKDAGQRLIVGTDKNIQGGLYVFDLNGKILKDKTVKALKDLIMSISNTAFP